MRVRLALIPIVAAALLAGCATPSTVAGPSTSPSGNGVAALAPADIITKAKAALTAAKSYHMKGSGTQNGKSSTLDVTIQGKNWAGTIQTNGLTLDVIVIGSDLYLKAPDAFLQALIPANQQGALATLKGKYLKTDVSTPVVSDYAPDFSPDDYLTTIGTPTKGDTKTINATPAIAVVGEDKSVIYVATEGEPYPLEAVDATGKSIDFTQFNTAPDVTAPAAADVFDLKALMGN